MNYQEDYKIWKEMDEIMEGAIMDDREKMWLPRMRNYMRGESILFVVGMDHLKGLLPNLRKSGYIVTPLDIGIRADQLSLPNGIEYLGTFKNGKIWDGTKIHYYIDDDYIRSNVSSNKVGDIHTITTFVNGKAIWWQKYHERELVLEQKP